MIFWVGSDESIFNFMGHNKPLQSLSEQYKLYIAHSGGMIKQLCKLYPNAHIVKCKNNLRPIKGAQIIALLKDEQFDVVIRVCPDAVIMDLGGLVAAAQCVVGEFALFGNLTIKKSKGQLRQWIRGACNITTKAVIDAVRMKPGERPKSFDQPFSNAVVAAGAKLINRPLFEISNNYSGSLPVWHPIQKGIGMRFKSFKQYASIKLPTKSFDICCT